MTHEVLAGQDSGADGDSLLSETARRHAMRPLGYGSLEGTSRHAVRAGACGDRIEMWVEVRDGVVERVSFRTEGCGASRASGSMAVSLATGRALSDVLALKPEDLLRALGGLPAGSAHCAELAVSALRAACEA